MALLQYAAPWLQQPQEAVELNPGFPAIAGFVSSASGAQILAAGAAEPYAEPTGPNLLFRAGPGGIGAGTAGSVTDTLRLHSVANQTDTIWEQPKAQVSVALFLRRNGNTGGNSPMFGNLDPNTSPYTAWGLIDGSGTGALRFECSAGGAYRSVAGGTLTNNEDYVIVATYDGSTARLYLRGVEVATGIFSGNLTYPNYVTRGPTAGNFFNYTGAGRAFNGLIYGGILHDGAWSPDLVRSISSPSGFWQFVRPQSIWVPVSAGGAVTHATSGALAAAGATIAGTAAHIAKHATSGVLAGSGATVAGSAARTRAHPASGVLAGGGASVAGTARHNVPHPTSGALAGGGAEIAGVADHAVPGGTHDTSGALAGGGGAVSGTAAHIAVHGASGALAGGGGAVAGDAARVAAAVTHATSGALVGGGAVVDGVARGPGPDAPAQETAYATPRRKREYRYDYSPAPVVESPIAQALAKAIEVKAEKSGVDRAEIEKTLRRVADLGEQQEAVTRQIEAEAREIEQARLVAEMQRLQDAEDAEVAEVLAMLL